MNILDDIIKLDDKDNIIYAGWIEWVHFLVPNKPEWLREIMRNLVAMLRHCLSCTVLDGCYLQERNKPELPLHEHCDCQNTTISYNMVKTRATSECAIEKFTKYIFKSDIDSKGKIKIFNKLGYTINDAEYLRNEYCKQALTQYLHGNYKLKNLDKMGQRLAIPITLGNSKFYSGWMLYPEGKIKNTTPFGGWIK